MLVYGSALLAVFSAGALIILQAPINLRLGTIIGGPVAASLASFAVGLAALVLVALLARQMPNLAELPRTAPWMWVGGLLGAWIVVTSVWAVPMTGTTLLFALIFAGQMVGALLIDHYGFLLPETHPVNTMRLLGVALLAAVVFLIHRF